MMYLVSVGRFGTRLEELDDGGPESGRPLAVGPHVGRTALPVPDALGRGPFGAVIGLDVGQCLARNSHLQLQKLAPAQRERREHVPDTPTRTQKLAVHPENVCCLEKW
jgi:hypothetical protein